MLISLNWLKDYIDLPKNLSPKQLAHDLTMATVEVENVIDQAQSFDKMVIGKVIELKNHPNADKLKIAMTDIGSTLKHLNTETQKHHANDLVQIVCGGVNLRQGMMVQVALPGSKVKWHGEGEPVVLEEAKIRGEKSFGMICSSNEIGLDNMFPCDEMEIVDLSHVKGLKVGSPLAKALGLNDVIIEIDNKSLTNRPDLWCHYGIARELAAIYNLKLKSVDLLERSAISDQRSGKLDIKILDKKACPRYFGCEVKNIKIGPSPDWLVKRLEAVGQRAINNIVNITNYIMFDVGEPTHAFDKSKLAGGKIIVRRPKAGETIKTLDDENRKLDPNMLVIADAEKAVAAAGVMGGANSEVSDDTHTLILECANFDAMTVRKMSQKLGLRTEGSMRWEKALDPNLAEIALLRMLKLIKSAIPGVEVVSWVDKNYANQNKTTINVGHKFLEQRIGQSFKTKDVINILNRLGFDVAESDGMYTVTVPSWRATGDVSIPEDIVEEVARIYGYENLAEKQEMVELTKAKYQPEYELENKIKNYLSLGCGMHEVFNYPWYVARERRTVAGISQGIEIANPPAEENRFLQTTLIPNLLKNIEDNLRYYPEFKLFELARVFKPGAQQYDGNDKLPVQPKMLAGVVVTKKDTFLEIKGILSGMNLEFGTSAKLGFLNKNKSLEIMVGDKTIGWLGEMKEKIKNKNIGLFEIDFDKLVETQNVASLQTKYKPLPQYPSIERDIAVEISWQTQWNEVKKEVEKIDKLVYNIEFLSEYDLGNKKSLAFRVIYQADRTLKDAEVEVVQNKIIKMLKSKFNAELRK